MSGVGNDPEDEPSRELHQLADSTIDTLFAEAQYRLVITLAHSLCTETVCWPTGACNAAGPPARCALARAIESMRGGILVQRLAELRIFARLSIAECSDFMALNQLQLMHRWRVAKTLLFPRARQLLRECKQRQGG